MYKININGIYVFIVIILFVKNAQAGLTISAQALTETQIPHLSVLSICEQLNLTCQVNDSKLYRVKASNDPIYYLIDATPRIVQFQSEGKKIILLDQWEFKDYKHSHQTANDDEEWQKNALKIYPALYPINKNKMAVAIIDERFESYAGGGRSEQIADFLMLEPQGKFKVALKAVSFHSYEMIRACFSEQEYKTSPHCYDESSSILSIQFKDIRKPFYQWTLNYTDFTWDAGKSEKFKNVKKSSEVVMPFGVGK